MTTRSRRLDLLILMAAVALGLLAESVAFEWDDARHWVPDLIVGLLFTGGGLHAWRRNRGVGMLLVATGVAWFLGSVANDLLYLHRGPLVHLLLVVPMLRLRCGLDVAAVTIGYGAAVAPPVWRSETAGIILAAALLAVAVRGWSRATGRARTERMMALQATTLIAVALAGGAIARLVVSSGDAVEPALLVYQAVLAILAVMLAVRASGPAATVVADLVVELGESRSLTLRAALARTLGDPTLQIGYWSAQAGAYVDESGGALELPGPGTGRSATPVTREGTPHAILVHDAAVLGDSSLVNAVASATRLFSSNNSLQAEIGTQVRELTDSRLRLVVVADDERRRLAARLHAGPQRRLASLAETLRRVSPRTGSVAHEHLERAERQLAGTLDELRQLGSGLHPRALIEAGLLLALAGLAEDGPVPVELRVVPGRFAREVEAAVYFVCAEALANIAKHGPASNVTIDISRRSDGVRLIISDDGPGGADPAGGTGLRGLGDRVDALGGTFRIESPPGRGTRLVADLPIGDEAR